MLAKETTIDYKTEEQRIENAFQAREMCDVDSWGFNYWNNVLGFFSLVVFHYPSILLHQEV